MMPDVIATPGVDVREKTCSVEPLLYDADRVGHFGLFVDGAQVAASTSARSLVVWAFDRGALKVRSDYDLRHER
jgi:hypothetical protein